MTKVVLNGSVSLDGYSAGPNVSDEHPMGEGGERLHEWLFAEGSTGVRQDEPHYMAEVDHYQQQLALWTQLQSRSSISGPGRERMRSPWPSVFPTHTCTRLISLRNCSSGSRLRRAAVRPSIPSPLRW